MAFQESQKMNRGLRMVVLFAMIPGLFIVGKALVDDYTTETLVAFLVMLVVFVLIFAIFINGQAEIRIDSQGFHYKYFPFVPSWKVIPWTEITEVKITPINPLTDFGGWGYRWGRKGKGIILAGNRAIVISKAKGKNFVFTTQQEQRALRELQHYAAEKLK